MATSTSRTPSVERPSGRALAVTAAGSDIRLSMVGVPIILSLSSAVGGIVLAVRLVAHRRAAEAAQR